MPKRTFTERQIVTILRMTLPALATIAGGGLVFFWTLMPKTRNGAKGNNENAQEQGQEG